MSSLTITALTQFPLVQPGDDLNTLIIQAIKANQLVLKDGDIVALAQKVVSKAQNRYRLLDQIEVGQQALDLALATEKDPRLVQAILDESYGVVKHRPGVLIVEHKQGFVHANAGIDQSNISHHEGERLLLLPLDPDKACAEIRAAINAEFAVDVAVLINDSGGRAWRNGIVGFTLGCAGLEAVQDKRGAVDLFGRTLAVTETAFADEVAAAASLLMGQAGEGKPVVVLSGLTDQLGDRSSGQTGQTLMRHRDQDLFR